MPSNSSSSSNQGPPATKGAYWASKGDKTPGPPATKGAHYGGTAPNGSR